MKIARNLAVFFLFSAAWARADWLQDYEADTREAKTTDLDAVPGKTQMRENQDPEVAKEEKTKADALKKEEQTEYDQKNWLVEAYQAQQDAREKADAAASDNANNSVKPHDQATTSLRGDSSLETVAAPGSPSSLIKPFLGGISPVQSLPYAAPAPFLPSPAVTLSSDSSPAVSDSEPQRIVDPSAMDIPGMTAQESDPNHTTSTDNQTLIPGQNPNDSAPAQPLDPTLPLAKNSEQLEQLQKQAMGLPQLANKKPDTVQPGAIMIGPAALPPKGDEDERVSAPESMHNRGLSDPFDILH